MPGAYTYTVISTAHARVLQSKMWIINTPVFYLEYSEPFPPQHVLYCTQAGNYFWRCSVLWVEVFF